MWYNTLMPAKNRAPNLALANWLRTQMRQHDITHNELARRSGVPGATITRIVRSGHVPRPATLHTLADFFGVERNKVLELAGVVRLPDLPADVPPDLRDLIRRLARLAPADRRVALDQIEGLLGLIETIRGDQGAPAEEPAAETPHR